MQNFRWLKLQWIGGGGVSPAGFSWPSLVAPYEATWPPLALLQSTLLKLVDPMMSELGRDEAAWTWMASSSPHGHACSSCMAEFHFFRPSKINWLKIIQIPLLFYIQLSGLIESSYRKKYVCTSAGSKVVPMMMMVRQGPTLVSMTKSINKFVNPRYVIIFLMSTKVYERGWSHLNLWKFSDKTMVYLAIRPSLNEMHWSNNNTTRCSYIAPMA